MHPANALIMAASHGFLDIVKELVTAHANPKAEKEHAVAAAAYEGDLLLSFKIVHLFQKTTLSSETKYRKHLFFAQMTNSPSTSR